MTSSCDNTQKVCGQSKEMEGEEEKGREVRKKDWLELTLGFGTNDFSNSMMMMMPNGPNPSFSATQSSSSSSSFPSQEGPDQVALLGLRIGNCDRTVEDNNIITAENYLALWSEKNNLSRRNDNQPFSSPSSSFMLCRPTSPLQSRNIASTNFLLDPHGQYHHYPQRPNPGLWFTLRSAINRDGEVLPQIPTPYIRVKDANLTVFMVKSYLVRKLGLSNEAEVEVTCMGQNLLHSQTMKHVRDTIWLPKLVEFLNSNPTVVQNAQCVHHLMSLDYGRSCLINKKL